MEEQDTPSLFNLEGRVAVVTGGGRGIGAGIAQAFVDAGAKVVLAARRKSEIDEVAQILIDKGGDALAVQTDVTDPAAVQHLADTTLEHFGGLHVWVNNAGGSPMRMPIDELPPDEWDRTIALNLTAVYRGSVIAARAMRASQVGSDPAKGSIINITSGAGTGPVPGSAHYGAAKAGVNSLTWTLAAEFAPDIRVNAVAPGAIPTEVMLQAVGKDETQLDELLAEWNIPLGRLGTPQDIGAACLYLASQASSWVSGEIIRVGGGAKPR